MSSKSKREDDPRDPRRTDEAVVLELRDPITIGEGEAAKTYDRFTFKPLRAKHLRSMKVGEEGHTVGELLEIGAKMAGVSDVVFDELGPRDIPKVIEIVSGFMAAFLDTGAD